MKVLIVEDDINVAQSIQHLLAHYHYAVDTVADAETGLQMAEAFAYDLAIIDIVLPGINGLRLCQQLRQAEHKMPILLLTGQQNAGPQRAAALNVGADDYVAKPFDAEELVARVQALLRRQGANPQPILTWGALSIDPSSRRVIYGTMLLSPTPKEYAILELLLRQTQTTFSAAEILDRVWDSAESPGEEVVRYHIKELRQKLTAAGATKDFIKTIHGVGYRLNPLFSEALAKQAGQTAELPQVVELASANEQLRQALEALQCQSEALRLQNEALQKTQNALEQERWRYQDLFENAPVGYLITDAQGIIQAANRAAASLLAVTSERLNGCPLIDCVHPDDHDQFRIYLHRHQWPLNWEVRVQPFDQSAFSVLIAVTPTLDEQQQVVELRWMLRDIRDRYPLERQLRTTQAELEQRVAERTATLHERETFLRGIYDGAAQAIFVVDVTAAGEYRFVDFNQVALELSGLSLAEIQNQTPEAVFGPAVGGEFRQHYQDCVEAGHSIAYEERVELDGRTLWTMTTLSPIRNRDGEVYRLVGTIVDISDRKQAELRLQAMSSALSHAVDGISHLDKQGHYTFVNEAYARIVGYPAAEMLGMSWENTVHPDDLLLLKSAFRKMIKRGKAEVEASGIRKDGSLFYKQATLVACYDDQQRYSGHYCFMKDVSDRKQAEMTLQQQIRQEYLLADIAQDIRRSLHLEEVLSRTVHRVRELLKTDRVIIFRFRPDWQGDVIKESVGPGWTSILSTTIYDPCFKEKYIEPYHQGHISAMGNIDEDHLEPCYVELLKPFQVKANLVVPILQGETLWGLLIAHHCAAPRQWQLGEIALLRRLGVQVGIAIQQSELYEQTHRELVAREQMQAVLEESEARFRTLSAAAPVGILQTNADGICLYTNEYWQTMSGLSFEASLGSGWQQAIHPSDRASVHQQWEEHLHALQECQSEFRLLTVRGEIRWVAVRAATLRSATDEIIGHVCIVADITEQKQAAQKIEEQAALLDIAPDAIFVCDLDDRILYWNKGAENLYGWTAAEAQGQKAHELLQEDPDQLASVMTALFDRGEWRGEMVKVTKAGEQGVVESRWTLVRDEAGQPKYVLNVNTDITNQKKLEAQFYQAQKLESLGQLASGIAHDLNNVFTPILTVSQILQLKPLNLDDKSRQLLQLLESSARRGASMVQQILTVTRRGQGERELLDPIAISAEVIEIAQQSFPKAIQIQCEFTDPDDSDRPQCMISIDPTQLHQILMNLMVNARDAMPTGGTLTLSAYPTCVDEAIAQANIDAQVGDYWVVAVTDTGTGIAPEVRDRIFDPFFTTKDPGKGTGLGLSTVLSLVREADGFLEVFSETGEGTTVKIYFPIIASPAQAAPAPVPTTTPTPPLPLSGQSDWILVVDDDETVQQATQSLLEDHQYVTVLAKDGPAAIALYTQHQAQIRLVILDITMPIMSGIEVIERLRALDSSVRIIAISGLPTNQEHALTAGANIFLGKPYALDALLAEVEILMSEW